MDSETEHWLKLTTAVDIIGDMIAYYHGPLCEELVKADPDKSVIDELTNKVDELGQERRKCYKEGEQDEVILKAYTIYGPFLKNLRQSRRI